MIYGALWTKELIELVYALADDGWSREEIGN